MESEKDGSYLCWLNDKGSVILSNKQDKTVLFHHIVVLIAEHKSLVEAVICIQSSFPNKYKFPVTSLCNDGNNSSNEITDQEQEIGDTESEPHHQSVINIKK